MQGVVEAKGEGAEWTERFVAAAVGQLGSPEVVVQDVGPRTLAQEVLVRLNGSTERTNTKE